MRSDIAQALLLNVLKDLEFDEVQELRKYFQNMARYKYDDYRQFFTGRRFIESLALWLNQMSAADKKIALDLVQKKLIFVSSEEINQLVVSAFPDIIKPFYIADVASEINQPTYFISHIVNSVNYRKLIRQSLFCGMSDGARIEIFRRANTGIISHEQVYQTHELSIERASKMKAELVKDIKKITGLEPNPSETKFKRIFLLDDFSASGTSYLKFDNETKTLKGKIAAFYKNLYGNNEFDDVIDRENLAVYVIIYLCTEQAKHQIESVFNKITEEYGSTPKLVPLHTIPNSYKLSDLHDVEIIKLCQKEDYYDADELEDIHTSAGGENVMMGFSNCALPLVLSHNTPNNSVSLLWSYSTSSKFVGLFPRIPRHKEI